MVDEPGPNGIAEDIAEDGEQVAVLLNRKAFEAPLPDVAMTLVVLVVAKHVAG